MEEPMTHVFLKPCGCVSCLIVNVPEMFNELAKQQRYAMKHNLNYELMSTQAVREMNWKCAEHERKK